MKSRFTEEQIVKIINRHDHGEKAKDICRDVGISQHTLYTWKKKFKGMTVSEAKRTRALEAENSRLKKLVADLSLDNQMLRDVNSRKW
jgi:putative transposase